MNLLTNGGFETFTGSNCPSGCGLSEVNSNCDCVPGWFAPAGSPDLNPSGVSAFEGSNLLCTAGVLDANGSCETEAFAQNVSLIVGQPYQLSFRVKKTSGTQPSGIRVFLANGLTNTSGIPLHPDACPTGSGWVSLHTSDFNASDWTLIVINFTPTSATNNQLLFFPVQTSGISNQSQFICWDDMILTCASLLTVDYTVQYQGGGVFQFSGFAQNPMGISNLEPVSWCWEFGDGSLTANGQNVTHTYATPGAYEVCVTMTDNRGCTLRYCEKVEYVPCACAENSTVLSPGVQNYTGPALVERDIILQPGTHLSINSQTLQINTGCKFVVMRGASLTVSNSTLINACDGERWQGIVVWGNTAQNHDISYRSSNPPGNPINGPGVVRIRSNSRIEGANTALELQRWWSDPRNDAIYASISGTAGAIPDFWGGQVYAAFSTFFNNRKSGDIGAYPNNNLGLFNNCTFTSDNPITGNNGLEGVNLWNTNGVQFEGCTFDMVPARGITAIDAGITVYRTTFQNNYQGMKIASVTNPLANTLIGNEEFDRNYFYSNNFGIFSDGITSLRVRRNTFGGNTRVGIRISGNSSFRADGNAFFGHPIGVELINTGFIGQRLDCNFHQDLRGIRVRGYCRGMQFNDNVFDNQASDLHMSQSGGMLGDIFLNQGSNNAARLNRFSENESDNDIVTESGQTMFFRYYPPTGDDFTAAELARMLPDCDDNDGCTVPNNYHNEPASKPYSDCALPEAPPGGDAGPCTDRDCLDSLSTRLAWLHQQIAAGQSQYQADAAATELRFAGDKINLVGQWLAEGNIDLIEQTLNAHNTLTDRQLLFAVYTKRGNLSGAATLLAAMPESTEPEQWYKSTQGTYLQYLAAPGQYQATAAQDSVLELAGVSTLPVGANARALYYLLHGVWLEPDIEGDGIGDRKGQIPTAMPVVNILQLLPNPANATVEVVLSGSPVEASVQIIDAFGSPVMRLRTNGAVLHLSTADLPAGLYFIRQLAPDGRLTAAGRLIVQH